MRFITFTLAIALSALGTLNAQQIKIAYVQTDVLAENFPEYEDASKTYEKEITAWQNQLNGYQTEIGKLEEEYQQRAMLYSPEKKKEKQDEITAKRREAVQFSQDIFGPQGQAERRKMELLAPIYEKINRAIEILGDRDNYTMIFNSQGLLYAKEELDVTEEVLKILKAGVDVSPSGTKPSTGPRK